MSRKAGLEATPEATVAFRASALKRAAREGDVSEALRLLRALPEPDVADFTTALGACGRRKDLRVAKLLLAELLSRQIEPTMATWTAFLSAQGAERTSRCLEEMQRAELRVDEVPSVEPQRGLKSENKKKRCGHIR